MTALDITTSRDYFKIRLNEIYIDLLYYLSYPIESQNTKLPAPNDLDAQIEQINKNMFKSKLFSFSYSFLSLILLLLLLP